MADRRQPGLEAGRDVRETAFTELPHAYYYVRMNYAFGSAEGWQYQSEWIPDYQSGAYQALTGCSV